MDLLLALLFLTTILLISWSWRYRHDQSERARRSELALRSSQSRLAQLSSELPIALFSFRPGIGFEAISEGISRLLPISADALIGDAVRLSAIVAAEDRVGLQWLIPGAACPATVNWLGRVEPGGIDHQGPRWLQIRGSVEINHVGEHILTGIISDVSEIQQTRVALERSREALHNLSTHRENEREQEYRRLAREFHDELGQVLTGARMRTTLLAGQLAGNEPAQEALAEIETMLADAYRTVKSIAAELRPPALNLGLRAALEWLAERFLAPAGIRYSQSIAPVADTLPDTMTTSLFRILQEAMTNTVRYAKATIVHVSLRTTAQGLQLSISDDGCGFVVESVSPLEHFGLSGMRERVSALNGLLDIDSAPGEGTRISVTIPLPDKEN